MNVLPRSCRELAHGEQEEGIGLSQEQTELHIHQTTRPLRHGGRLLSAGGVTFWAPVG